MKSPEKNPPAMAAATAIASATEPTIDIAQQAITGMEKEETAPKMTPPQRATEEGDMAVGVAVKQTDKRITGLYTTYHPRNGWMYVAGLGWKRFATTSDSTQEAMSLLAAHCREKNCRIDYTEDNGVVTEMYVW